MLFNAELRNDVEAFDSNSTAKRMGRRIRNIRTAKNLSQAELGELIGLNADRVQKYENGIRKPKTDMLINIANALGVSAYAIMDPDTTTYDGAMYAMFELEHLFNMEIEEQEDGKPPRFCLSANHTEEMYSRMEEWYKVYTQTKSQLEAATSDEEREEIMMSYRMWQWTYPKALVDETDKAHRKAQLQKQIDKLQQMKDELDDEG